MLLPREPNNDGQYCKPCFRNFDIETRWPDIKLPGPCSSGVNEKCQLPKLAITTKATLQEPH